MTYATVELGRSYSQGNIHVGLQLECIEKYIKYVGFPMAFVDQRGIGHFLLNSRMGDVPQVLK